LEENIRRVKGIYTTATISTQEKDLSGPTKQRKIIKRASSEFKNQIIVFFFSLPKIQIRTFVKSSFVFVLDRAELGGGDVYKGGRDHKTHNQRREWVSTP
jgi:hypothetical protein